MIRVLARLLIKDYQNTEDERVRRSYGMLCSVVGIVLNLLLFAGKYAAGVLSASIAITADAFNNLSDAGSSLITLIGFRIAGKRADKGHPFGHRRMEYVSGLMVALIILLMGVEVVRDAVGQILHPEAVSASALSIGILLASIGVKLCMAEYNHRYGKKLQSAAMQAAAADSISDVAATSVVLVCAVIASCFGVNLDGICGLAVGCFILYAGYCAARDTLNPLLGEAPDPGLVRQIEDIVRAHPEILDVHDLIVHDYGPGCRLISLHGEVSGEENIYHLHDVIDGIERELEQKIGCRAVIHMDPVPVNDKRLLEMKKKLTQGVKVIHPNMTVHDLHVLEEDGKECVTFDVVLPDCGLSDEDALHRLVELTHLLWGDDCQAIIRIDH